MKRVLPLLLVLAAPAGADPPGIANTPSVPPPPPMSASPRTPPPTAINAVTGERQPIQVIDVLPAPGTPGIVLPDGGPPEARAVPPAKIVRSPQPRQAAQDLLTPSDYPPVALKMHAQGRVGMVLTIDTHGRVAACAIAKSSHSAALDAAACRILRSRGRFTPAMDSNGNPAEAAIEQEVKWRLP
jgi:protein TonB